MGMFILICVSVGVGFVIGLLVGRNNPAVADEAAVLANKAKDTAQNARQ